MSSSETIDRGQLDAAIVRALRVVGDRVATTGEVTDALPTTVSTSVVRERLHHLADRGTVGRKEIGAAWAWWLADGHDADADRGTADVDERVTVRLNDREQATIERAIDLGVVPNQSTALRRGLDWLFVREVTGRDV